MIDFPITIRHDSATSISQQIKYQLRYVITSGRLSEGTKLPTVRAAARHLEVNPGTVALAYKDLHTQGLLEATPGRGTFVAATLDATGDEGTRRQLLNDALTRAMQRARALGFRGEDIRQHAEAVLDASRETVPVVFAAPSTAIARKYASSLERSLGPRLAVHPVTFDELNRRAPHVVSLFDSAYFIVTFAGAARDVENSVNAFPLPTRVLGCTTEVQPHTLAALEALDPAETVCVCTQEPYLPPTLNLLEQRAGRPESSVKVCLDGDEHTARTVFGHVDRVVYTFVARDFVVHQGVPPGKRLEVTFDLTETSIARLREVLLPDTLVIRADEHDGSNGHVDTGRNKQ